MTTVGKAATAIEPPTIKIKAVYRGGRTFSGAICGYAALAARPDVDYLDRGAAAPLVAGVPMKQMTIETKAWLYDTNANSSVTTDLISGD